MKSKKVTKPAAKAPIKSSRPKLNLNTTTILLTVVTIAAVVGLFAAADMMSNKHGIRGYCQQTEQFIMQNQPGLETIFTSTFDKAKSCDKEDLACRAAISTEIQQTLVGKDEIQYFPSTYFVRAGAGETIEKLFLSGEYKEITSPNAKEMEVVKLLSSTRSHRICDQGWKIDSSRSTMKYLKDFPSEAEIIIPVQKEGKTIGAVVKAWGD